MKKLQFDSAIYDTIRKNIKKYRKEKGLTSAQLAELVDLSHDFIRQIESEKAHYNFRLKHFTKFLWLWGLGWTSWQKNRKISNPIFYRKNTVKKVAIFLIFKVIFIDSQEKS